MIAESQDEAEIIRIGEEAVRAVRQTFERWMEIARALEVGRHWAMAEAGTNQPVGRTYAQAFNRWLERHPVFASLKESTRSWIYRCYENRVEIAKWREERGAGEIDRYNYPETVFKRWRRYTQPKPAGEPRPPAVGKRDQAIIDLRQKNETLSREMEELRAEKERLEERLRELEKQREQEHHEQSDRGPRRIRLDESPDILAQRLYAREPDQAVATARAILELNGQTDAARNAPAPASSKHRVFDFGTIGVGESRVYPYDQGATSGAVRSHKRRHGGEFKTHKVDDTTTEVMRLAPQPPSRRRDRSETGPPNAEGGDPGTSLRDSAEISTEVTRVA